MNGISHFDFWGEEEEYIGRECLVFDCVKDYFVNVDFLAYKN